ncbi:LysR family transcriptional regulator [Macrococcoides canis]|uniref:LysR family transcriptional regulator n=1 Tax=Macrococcoides canis TaxID=1855823 RepID=UPI00105C6DAC|nr:LysR family transcriptional regulator [Macrococcus canis]TDM22537.1 LysR family transcriptional regulator [Macrococcus canis]TDM35522.1 LysR family transcriptional regulator [Macrococcus canis]
MDIKQLRYFDAIVKHGKISWAANALYISQPSLSMSLSKLEDEYDSRFHCAVQHLHAV